MHQQDKLLKKSFKYRIYPTAEQKLYLAKVFGCCRYVYNQLLAETKQQYELYKKHQFVAVKTNLTGIGMAYRLPSLKQEPDKLWLNDAPAQVLQQSVHNLADAYKNFFKSGSGYPKFKKRSNKQSATFTNQIYSVKENKLKLLKLDSLIKVKWHRELPRYKLGELTVTKTSTDKYYICISCEYLPKQTNGQGIVGIDVGISNLAVISDGSVIPNPKHYLKQQHKLANAQRSVSRKKKGSANRKKAVRRLAAVHERTANRRNDYLHKLTSRLISENQAICIEDLKVSNMSRNRKLSKHIMDAAWGTIRQQLTYKAVASQHCRLIIANQYYPSSHICSHCEKKLGHKLKLSDRGWVCGNCGSTHDRDANAAKNLELLARSQLKLLTALNDKSPIVLAPAYTDYYS